LSLVNMSMTHEAIVKSGKVVGVTLVIMFAAKPKPSASGKTLIDFSTRGNQVIDVGGRLITAGINMYHKP